MKFRWKSKKRWDSAFSGVMLVKKYARGTGRR